MLTNATSEQQAATQDNNCLIEHKSFGTQDFLKYNQA